MSLLLTAGCTSVETKIARVQRRSKGFGFVTMNDADQANAAIDALNGTELGGRALKVNEARPREERPRRDRNDSW